MSNLDKAEAELADAEARLKRLREQWDGYTGHNSNRYPFAIKDVQREVSVAQDKVAQLSKRRGRG